MPCPCSHLYSTRFSSGGGGQEPCKLSHSLNSSVHEPSLVQTMGTCKAEGEWPALLALPGRCPSPGERRARTPLPRPEKSSPRQLGCSHLVQPMCTDQKASCVPAAAGCHQRESASLLLTRPFPSTGQIPGWKGWAGSSLHPQGSPVVGTTAAAWCPSSQVNAFPKPTGNPLLMLSDPFHPR